MSYFDNIDVQFSDSPNIDNSGRLRISNPITLYENKYTTGKNILYVSESTSGIANSTFIEDSTINMTVGTTIGDRIVRQSKKYISYQPGKTQRVMLTSVLNSNPSANIRTRVGIFDDKNDIARGKQRGNGLYFELFGTTLKVVKRYTNATTLEQIDVAVEQANWNLDTLDGNGPSGVTIDTSKTNLFVIDYIWLGVGAVKFGIISNGQIIYCHKFEHIDLTTTYMNTPNLPIRYEMENVTGGTNSSVFKEICSTVISEGGNEDLNPVKSVDRGISIISVGTTLTPTISIRTKADSNRYSIDIKNINILNLSNRAIRYALYLNPVLTGSSWTSNFETDAEYDITATAIDITNATLLYSGYLNSTIGISSDVTNKLQAWSDITGNSDILCLAVQSQTATSDVITGLTYKIIL